MQWILCGESRQSISAHDVLSIVRCPISKKLLRDPVLAPDGHSYDREALATFQRIHGATRSPATGQPMAPGPYGDNRALRITVQDWADGYMGRVRSELALEWQKNLACPIGFNPMFEAVQLSDGTSVDRGTAPEMLRRFGRSPVTHQRWQDVEELVPNITLRHLVALTEGQEPSRPVHVGDFEKVLANLPPELNASIDKARSALGRMVAIETGRGGWQWLWHPDYEAAVKAALYEARLLQETYARIPDAAATKHEVQKWQRNANRLQARLQLLADMPVYQWLDAVPLACALRGLGVAVPGLGVLAGTAVWLARTCAVAPAVGTLLCIASHSGKAAPARRLAPRFGGHTQFSNFVRPAAMGAEIAGMAVSALGFFVTVPMAYSAPAVLAGAALGIAAKVWLPH